MLDFGTVKKINFRATSNDYYGIFKEKIKTLLTSRGSHGFSPIESNIYDWFPALFLKRNKMGNYLIKSRTHKSIFRANHHEYYIEENFKHFQD